MTSFHKIVLTPTTKLQDTWGGLAGIKMRSNVIIRSQTLFYVENCASLSDFLRMGMGGGGPAIQQTGIRKNWCYG